MKLLHFADAHIDMANYGKHDPETGLPLRVLDFLKALDTIVDAAISEKVDMVIFVQGSLTCTDLSTGVGKTHHPFISCKNPNPVARRESRSLARHRTCPCYPGV
jgi:hypothetical protein